MSGLHKSVSDYLVRDINTSGLLEVSLELWQILLLLME